MQELEETHRMLKEKVEGKTGPAKDHSKTLRAANSRMQFLLKYGSDVEILQVWLAFFFFPSSLLFVGLSLWGKWVRREGVCLQVCV